MKVKRLVWQDRGDTILAHTSFGNYYIYKENCACYFSTWYLTSIKEGIDVAKDVCQTHFNKNVFDSIERLT